MTAQGNDLLVLQKPFDNLQNFSANLEKQYNSIKIPEGLGAPDPFNPDFTIMASGLNVLHNENADSLLNLSKELVRQIEPKFTASAKSAIRVGAVDGRNDIVKFALATVDEKRQILRGKNLLRQSEIFYNVTIRSSQPHAVRLMEKNVVPWWLSCLKQQKTLR